MKGSQKKLKEAESQNVTQLYDSALPETLQYEGILIDSETTPGVKTNANIPLSPYIIKLAHDNETTSDVSPNLDLLAQQLLMDAEDFQEENNIEDELEVDFADLVAQLREPEFNENSEFTTSQRIETTYQAPVASTYNSALSEHIDIFAVLDEQQIHKAIPSIPAIQNQNEKINRAPKRKIRLTQFFPRVQSHHRAFIAFTLLSFVFVLPLQAMQSISDVKDRQTAITESGKNALDTFMRGASALNDERFDIAQTDFAKASDHFSEAEDSLHSLNSSVATILSILPQTDKTYNSANGLLIAGKELSLAAEQLTKAAENIESQTSTNVVTKLAVLQTYVELAQPHIEKAVLALERVDADIIPVEYQTTVQELQTTTPKLAASMKEFITFSKTLSTILGKERKMRYLVTFQNNTELRPTGGFIGSFAEMDLLNGKIDHMYVPEGGTYDLQGQLSEFVASPHPLSLVNPRWEFHDSNWFPDFPTSAKKMVWFYENAGGPTVDGVIAINATFMPQLLEIVGPIEMPEYGRTIDSENFLFETQKIVELEYDTYQINDELREVEAPKQFIGDLAPKILERLENADTETMLAVLDLIGKGLSTKDAMLYFDNNALQSTSEALGWSGSIKQTTGDFLMVTHTNLGGGKTDAVIDQDIFIDTTLQLDGSIINTVTITKEHKGLKSALFEGQNNVDYLRLYVPQGSELISADGFEIPPSNLFETSDLPLSYDEDLALLSTDVRKDPNSQTDIWVENGKTVFGNWMQTAPSEIETVTFTYKLPFKLTEKNPAKTLFEVTKNKLGLKDLETYSILIQKQPGVITRETHITLTLPENKNVIWSSHNASETTISNDYDALIQFVIESN